MKRQNIILGDYKYLVDLYKYNVDDVHKTQKYVIIRDFNIMNNIVYNNTVLFIEKSIIDECTLEEGKIDTELLASKIVYPITNKDKQSYTTDYTKFNYTFNEDSFKNGIDVNTLYNSEYNEAYIGCDKLRLYLPITNKDLKAIVCVSAFIGDIHFYFLCRTLSQYEINSETEFSDDNDRYSQFYDMYIPSLECLFNGNTYIAEKYNINELKKNLTYTDEVGKISLYSKILPKYVKNYEDDTYTLRNKLQIEFINDNHNEFDFSVSFTKNGETNNLYFNARTVTLVYDKQKLNDYDFSLILGSSQSVSPIKNLLTCLTLSNSTFDMNMMYDQMAGRINIHYIKNVDNLKGLNFTINDIDLFAELGCSYANVTTPSAIFKCNNLLVHNNEDICNGDTSEININLYGNIQTLSTNWLNVVNNVDIIDLRSLTLPFLIDEQDIDGKLVNVKIFNDTDISMDNDYTSSNLVVTVYPYTEINEATHNYEYDGDDIENSEIFSDSSIISLRSSFSFDDKYLIIQSTFDFPGNDKEKTLCEVYCKKFGVTLSNYLVFDVDKSEYELDFDTNINTIGYRLDIALDNHFTNIIYTQEQPIELSNNNTNFIDDFYFELNDIFSSWDNMPELLVMRTAFIDKVTMNVIYSNPLLVTKEQYKFLINPSKHKIYDLKFLQNNLLENEMGNNFNFIDKINCVINKTENNTTSVKTNNTPKVIYKPIFFKVATLQNIRIKTGVKQNIGVNLSDTMTKVEQYKMTIGDLQLIEYARNDVYVLFNINAAELSSKSGSYTITNENDEYISDGSWILY